MNNVQKSVASKVNLKDSIDLIARHQTFSGSTGTLKAERFIEPEHYISGGRLQGEDYDDLKADLVTGLTYVVYSYGTPIAWVTADGSVHHVKGRFSVTTSKQQNYVRRGLGSND